jgi:glutamate-1-semialdehyde 2,1-aminomutase
MNKPVDDSALLRKRLHRAVPGGAHTYSRGDDQFPASAPPLLIRGKGAYVWDAEGRQYLDYGMALRAVTIGYADQRVNRAAADEMDKGVNLTRATLTELEAAEALIDLVPSIEMVKFGKNGSNVTTAAVKIARAYTGRTFVCIPRQHPFFSFDDWFIGTTVMKRGVVTSHAATTLAFDYGDIASLEALFAAYPGQIAAVMLEPATTALPCPAECRGPVDWPSKPCSQCPNNGSTFLHQVQRLCRENGTVFVLDEMITGFRWHLAGAQTFFGVEPDLTTFGKGMANGFSVAAVGGRRELMEVGAIDKSGMQRTFLLSTTHGAEMTGLGAFLATLQIYEAEDVVGHLWAYGASLRDGIAQVAVRHGLTRCVGTEGPSICLSLITRDAAGRPSLPLRTLLAQELLSRGVMMPWIAVCQAHGEQELERTLSAFDGALAIYARALETGVERFLRGPAIRPVFREIN